MRVILENAKLDEKLNIDYVPKFRNAHKELYDVIFNLNLLCINIRQEIPKTFAFSKNKLDEIYIYITFIQMHDSFQSYITLMERGMLDDSYCILRTMFDKLINQQFINKNKSLYDKVLLKEYYLERKNFLKYIADNKKVLKLSNEYNIAKEIEECEQKIVEITGKGNAKKMGMSERAKKCKMQREYYLYKKYSSYIHNDLSALADVISVSDNILYVRDVFSYDNIVTQVYHGVYCLARSMKVIDKRFLNGKYFNSIDLLEKMPLHIKEKNSNKDS